MKKGLSQTIRSIFNFRKFRRAVCIAGALALPFLGGLGCQEGMFNTDIPPDLAFQIQACPADITVTAPDVAGATVTFTLPGVTYDATKVDGPAVEVWAAPRSGSFFPIGKTQVIVYATLRGTVPHGGEAHFTAHATCSFNVTVKPNIPDQTCTPPNGPAPAAGFAYIAYFNEGSLANIDPMMSLTEGCDGSLYGVTISGGQIVKIDKEGGSASVLYSRATDTVLSNAPLPGLARVREQASSGVIQDVFLGITPQNGPVSHAQIYRINADGSGLRVVHDFMNPGYLSDGLSLSWDGFSPRGRVIADKNGFIYGACWNTGFRMFYTGSGYSLLDFGYNAGFGGSQEYAVGTPALLEATGDVYLPLDGQLISFGADLARYVVASFGDSWRSHEYDSCLLAGSDGAIYGIRGQNSSDSTTPGMFYKYDPATDAMTVIANRSGAINPYIVSLAQTPDGWVYGIDGAGSLVRFKGPGQFEVVHQFAGNESGTGALLVASDGAVYGTASGAGPNGRGGLFRYYDGGAKTSAAESLDQNSDATTPATVSASANAPAPTDSVQAPLPLTGITLSTNAGGVNAGRALAMRGELLFVGVPVGTASNFAGAVHVFRRSGTNWNLESALRPPTNDNSRLFGYSLAEDRDTLVIGAPGDISTNTLAGSTYVFRQQGTNWSLEATLHGGAGTGGDEFGFSVAISGDSLIVGAPGYRSAGDHSGGAFIFQRTNTTWTQKPLLTSPEKAALDYFGEAVAIQGSLAVIGAPRGRALDLPLNSGAAYSYSLSGANWSWALRLRSSTRYNGDLFGTSIAAGDNYFVVGAPGLNPLDASDPKRNLRAACVFTNVRPAYPNSITESARLAPATPIPLEMFGLTVSADGPRITVGAPQAVAISATQAVGGAGYVFDRHGYHWTQVGRLARSEGQAGDAFGATSGTASNWVAIAAFAHSNTNAVSGTTYLFDLPVITAPTLALTRVPPLFRVSWPADFTGYWLEYKTNLASTNWTTVTPRPTTSYYDCSVTTNAARFFRLRLR